MNNRLPIKERNIRLIKNKLAKQADNKSPFESLRDWLGLAVSAGVFSALLYIAGRSYASGYFRAMNIPPYQVSFSIWEYGEAAWIPLVLFPLIILLIASLFTGLLSRLIDVVKASKFSKKKESKGSIFKLPESSVDTKLYFFIADRTFFILDLVGLLLLVFWISGNLGVYTGKQNVLQANTKVYIISRTPVATGIPPGLISGDAAYYDYDNLYLLTVNDNRYYLYNDVDKVTCKPAQVYILDRSNLVQVTYTENVKPDFTCEDELPKSVWSFIKFLLLGRK